MLLTEQNWDPIRCLPDLISADSTYHPHACIWSRLGLDRMDGRPTARRHCKAHTPNRVQGPAQPVVAKAPIDRGRGAGISRGSRGLWLLLLDHRPLLGVDR